MTTCLYATRISICFHSAILVAVCALMVACSSPPPPQREGGGSNSTQRPIFEDLTAEAGLQFVHDAGMSGELYIIELMGAGCGLLDFDNDGDLDLYLVQGHLLEPGYSPQRALRERGAAEVPADRLFRNDLEVMADGTRRVRFTDVTESAGIVAPWYGMGVATGDMDNDGWIDIFVTNWGPNHLWHNNGDGTFTDVAAEVGADDSRWSSSAAFADVNRDGWLDLYVAHYVDFSYATHRVCRDAASAPDYCGPATFNAETDTLLVNRGDGTFEDVSVPAGITGARSPGLGVAVADINSDGLLDIYVANDFNENHLWVNRGDGTFSDEALWSGCAVNWMGERESSMGVDAADFSGDGQDDIFVAHMDRETNTLYLNDGSGLFIDSSRGSGLGATSQRHTTYAGAWMDFDNDGLLDVMNLNGAMVLSNDWAAPGAADPLPEPNQLFRNLGHGKFEEIDATGDPVLEANEISRSGAVGDLDNDGDPDLVITNCNGPARVLLNRSDNDNHWLGLRLLDGDGLRDQLGAYVEVYVQGAPAALVRRARTESGYLTASDPRVLVGLGPATAVERLRVRWPSGKVEQWQGPLVDQYIELREGSGSPVDTIQ